MTTRRLFDERKISLARTRAARIAARVGAHHHGFLHQQAASIIGERLAATKRSFSAPVLLFDGPFSGVIEEAIAENDPPLTSPFDKIAFPNSEEAVLPLEPGSVDLIVSVFDLHRFNDLATLFFQINMTLKPDGLFLAVTPSAGTLAELQEAMMQTELSTGGGAAMRVDPFPELRQIGDLLQKTGFKLPVCDVEERTIRYGSISSLVRDLRGLGGSAAMASNPPKLPAGFINELETVYKTNFADSDGRLRVSVNMAFLSGWKEDASQQKPLRPGSAKHSLKDFL